MASISGSFGVSNTKFLSSKLICTSTYCTPLLPHAVHYGNRPTARRHASITISQKLSKTSTVCCAQSSLVTANEPAASRLEKGEEQKSFLGPVSRLIPNSDEVNYLLTEICDTTSIAEFELNLNGFHLHVTRSLSEGINSHPPASAPPSSASISANKPTEELSLNGPVSTTSLAITKAGPSEIKSGTLLERAADEGLVIIQSPKVGVFRTSRTIKGKRAPPACKEKQIVKEGQVICYIAELGNDAPVESDVAGEITKILCKDGEPVGYGDPIIAILPSFPGIKKLQ